MGRLGGNLEHDIGHIKKGDIVYVPFPLNPKGSKENIQTEQDENFESDPRETKERPGLVLWRAETDSFTVCAITSKPYREHKIELHGRDLDSGKIGYDPSFIRPNIIATVHRSDIRRKLGTLKPQKLEEVIDKVKKLLDAEPEEAPVTKALERTKKRIR